MLYYPVFYNRPQNTSNISALNIPEVLKWLGDVVLGRHIEGFDGVVVPVPEFSSAASD